MAQLNSLMSFDHKDPRSFEDWAIQHSSDHLDVKQKIQALGGANLPVWPLYPINWRDWDAWALRHQSAHNEANAALGIAGSDLTSVDFDNPQEAALWNQNHYTDHLSWHETLGI